MPECQRNEESLVPVPVETPIQFHYQNYCCEKLDLQEVCKKATRRLISIFIHAKRSLTCSL